jgi:hypothetical protein
MQTKITKRLVDSLKPAKGDYYVFDTETIGFAVRVRSGGGMTYIAQYKAGKGRGAPTRRITLGPIGRMTPDQARSAARAVLSNPVSDRGDRRLTLAEVADSYLRDHAAKRKGSTSSWAGSIIDRVIKEDQIRTDLAHQLSPDIIDGL